MKVKVYGIVKEELEEEEFDFEVTSISSIISLFNLHKGSEFVKDLLETKYYYILTNEGKPETSICLMPEVILSEFSGFDTLLIVPEISGDIPVPIILAGWLATAASISTLAAETILAVVGNMLIAVALGAAMQMLAPSPEFTSDPSTAQKASNLFNGAPLIREQGGSVPLVFGNPYCGGVLISSGVSTA